ncbi:MAG TPA: wax ester/triacylglycerol synthase family O-acyltransferase [Burkholderiales bacterium]|nr:wax ester/triacylglycerol synthase family O-acyltransferase [Burkholderiales bacterium]
MSTPPRERMTGVDTAWLRMDRPTNPMVIVGVMMLGERLDYRRLRHALERGFLSFDRFRQRPVHDGATWYWETDPNFDLERHVHRTALPAPAGKKELLEFVSDLASTSLDPQQPLWQFNLVERYGEGSALVIRIHHCYADGMALVRVLLSMTEEGPKPRSRAARLAFWPPGVESWFPWMEPMTGAANRMLEWSTGFWQRYLEMLVQPGKALEYAQLAAGSASEAVKLLTMSPEPATRLRGKPGLSKRAAWCEPLPLAEVKQAGKVLGCSINDMLLASAAGALRRYLVAHREKVDTLEIRVVVPVNLRNGEDADGLGNKFGMVFLQLPVGIANPLERLYTVRSRMQALKNSPQPMLVLGLLAASGSGPAAMQELLLQTLSSHATAVMTNVPGPQQRLHFAGAELAQQIFWVPQSGDIAIGASILSYAGQVQFGLITDAKIVPDPEKIVDAFEPEFRQLQQVAEMHPWESPPEPAHVERLLAKARHGKSPRRRARAVKPS